MQRPFVEAGMTDKETGVFPNFDALIGTCKRWVSIKKEIGIKKELKMHCKAQVQSLARIQIEEGGVSYEHMNKHGIPRGEFSFSIQIQIDTLYCLLIHVCLFIIEIHLFQI